MILQAVGMAETADEGLDLESLAQELGTSVSGVRMDIEWLEASGLMLSGLGEDLKPILLECGRQYLQRRGEVEAPVLRFLPGVIDDLHAREALLHAGTVLVDEFRQAVMQGDAVAHARILVPAAFVEAVDEYLAINLYSAAVGLMARLSDDCPAGCVAEEIIAVNLIDEAKARLEMRVELGDIGTKEAKQAMNDLRGVFELFQDDDVLDMFDMTEPADAALAGHSDRNLQMGVADQRIEAWFSPFGGVAPTGYLQDREGQQDRA